MVVIFKIVIYFLTKVNLTFLFLKKKSLTDEQTNKMSITNVNSRYTKDLITETTVSFERKVTVNADFFNLLSPSELE